jgi:hypothetical protein
MRCGVAPALRAIAVRLARAPGACALCWALVPLLLGALAWSLFGFVLHSGGLAPTQSIEAARYDALAGAQSEAEADGVLLRSGSGSGSSSGLPQQAVRAGSLVLIYGANMDRIGDDIDSEVEDDGRGDNVLSDPHLESLRELERGIVSADSFTRHCLRSLDTGRCAQPSSVTNFLFGTFVDRNESVPAGNGTSSVGWQITRAFSPTGTAQDPVDRAQLRAALLADPRLLGFFTALVGKDFAMDSFSSRFARSFFMWGGPQDGYDDLDDRELEQEEKLEEFAVDQLLPQIEDVNAEYSAPDSPTDGKAFDVLYAGNGVTDAEVLGFIIRDGLFSLGSTLFVFTAHEESLPRVHWHSEYPPLVSVRLLRFSDRFPRTNENPLFHEVRTSLFCSLLTSVC